MGLEVMVGLDGSGGDGRSRGDGRSGWVWR